MNYWIFAATSHRADGKTYSPEEILNQRIIDQFWGLGERTPNRKNLERGDKIIFYLGYPTKSFAANAELESSCFELNTEQKSHFAHGTDFYNAPFGVSLSKINRWNEMKGIEGLVPSLSFIENKPFWGTYLQGGIRQISENDYSRIIGSAPHPTDASNRVMSIEVSEFALESHLEEFIDRNWENINFGCKLKRYQVDDQNGRQFPAGQWSIDFLCLDSDTGDLVVIELKKGKTSDSVVGQILRYINYGNYILSSTKSLFLHVKPANIFRCNAEFCTVIA